MKTRYLVAIAACAFTLPLSLGHAGGGTVSKTVPSWATVNAPIPVPPNSRVAPLQSPVATPTTTTTTLPAPPPPTTTTVPAPVVQAPAPPSPPPTDVASLVAQVRESGINPGNWTWNMGDPTQQCGPLPSGVASGCTFGNGYSAQTVFQGVPTLGLVAHEMGNAEVENSPNLNIDGPPESTVWAQAQGLSWSPIDATSSCIVYHYMGFQDGDSGPWQCPGDLAAYVASVL